MGKKIAVVISVLALLAAALIFVNVYNVKKGPPGTGSTMPPGLKPDAPLDQVDAHSAIDAYGKAASLATRTPEADDIKTLIPVLLKFSPSELSTLTRLASRTMTKDENEQAKSILRSKLNQEEVNLLLQLGPKYGLDFRAVLGAADKPKR